MPDKSATFSKKAQAKAWGQKMEAEVQQFPPAIFLV